MEKRLRPEDAIREMFGLTTILCALGRMNEAIELAKCGDRVERADRMKSETERELATFLEPLWRQKRELALEALAKHGLGYCEWDSNHDGKRVQPQSIIRPFLAVVFQTYQGNTVIETVRQIVYVCTGCREKESWKRGAEGHQGVEKRDGRFYLRGSDELAVESYPEKERAPLWIPEIIDALTGA